jgi:DNA-binding NarL/FixJ family response regulator
MDRPYIIVIADHHMEFRRELRKILEEIPGIQVGGEAGNRHELFALLEQWLPALVILDISMPDLRAGEGTRLIKVRYPGIQVLITVLGQEREYVSHGLAAGAAGVLAKQYVAGQIGGAIATVRQGRIFLPPGAPGDSWPRPTTPVGAFQAQSPGHRV